MTHRIITIQPAGDPRGTMPYPYHLEVPSAPGRHHPIPVGRQDAWRGEPATLAGFQRGDVQEVVLWPGDFAAEPKLAIGLRPVFVDADGAMWSHSRPILSVHETEAAAS